MRKEVPICDKYMLTLPEAAAYFNIGINKLREMTDEPKCPYVRFYNKKRLINRQMMEEYLDSVTEI